MTDAPTRKGGACGAETNPSVVMSLLSFEIILHCSINAIIYVAEAPKRMASRVWYWILKLGKTGGLVLAVALLYTFYEAFKPPRMGGGLFPWDKADHFSAFFVLTGLAMVVFARQPLWRIAAVMAAIGAAIELIQGIPFVGRDCDFWDWFAELVAIAAVYAVVLAAKMRETYSAAHVEKAGDIGRAAE